MISSRCVPRRSVGLSVREELKRHAIHAITVARRLGTVVENMSEMTTAATAVDLGAD
jgi:hypothetical protein